MVSGASIAAMFFSLVVSVALPVVFLSYFRFRCKISFKAVSVGIISVVFITRSRKVFDIE